MSSVIDDSYTTCHIGKSIVYQNFYSVTYKNSLFYGYAKFKVSTSFYIRFITTHNAYP